MDELITVPEGTLLSGQTLLPIVRIMLLQIVQDLPVIQFIPVILDEAPWLIPSLSITLLVTMELL